MDTSQCKTLSDLKHIRLHYDMDTEAVYVFPYRFDLLDTDSNWTFLATMPLPLEPSDALLQKCKALNPSYHEWLPWNLWLGEYLSYCQEKTYLRLLPGEIADVVALVGYARWHPATTRVFAFAETERYLSQQLQRNEHFASLAAGQLDGYETTNFLRLNAAQARFQKEQETLRLHPVMEGQ
jgi:hypothetical protein